MGAFVWSNVFRNAWSAHLRSASNLRCTSNLRRPGSDLRRPNSVSDPGTCHIRCSSASCRVHPAGTSCRVHPASTHCDLRRTASDLRCSSASYRVRPASTSDHPAGTSDHPAGTSDHPAGTSDLCRTTDGSEANGSEPIYDCRATAADPSAIASASAGTSCREGSTKEARGKANQEEAAEGLLLIICADHLC